MSNPATSSSSIPSSPQEAIPDQYIIVFKPHLTASQRSAHHTWVTGFHLTSLSTHICSTDADTSETYTGVISTFNFGKFAGYVARVREDVKVEIEGRGEEVGTVHKNLPQI